MQIQILNFSEVIMGGVVNDIGKFVGGAIGSTIQPIIGGVMGGMGGGQQQAQQQNQFTPPPPPPPMPDVNQIKSGIANQEGLSRRPKGRRANIFTGSLGDTNIPNSGGGNSILG